MKVKVVFNAGWMYSGSGINAFAAGKLVRLVSEKFNSVEANSDSDTCEFSFEDGIDQGEVKKSIKEIIEANFKGDGFDKFYEIEVEGKEKPEAKSEKVPTGKPAEAPADKEAEAEEEPEIPAPQLIKELVGANAFKELCDELHLVAPAVLENKTYDIFRSECYLFAENSGCGFTNQMDLLSQQLIEDGLFDGKSKVIRTNLVDPADKDCEDKLATAASNVRNHAEDKKCIICIDISRWLKKTDTQPMKDFLRKIAGDKTKAIFVFKMPYESASLIRQTATDISDILSVRTVVIPPYTMEEMHDIAKNVFAEFGYEYEEGVWNVFDNRIYEEMNDGFFYWGHTVKRISNDMIRCAQFTNALNGLKEKKITLENIKKMTNGIELQDGDKSGWELLADLKGIEGVASQIKEYVNQIKFAKKQNMKMPCMHVRFVGNAGTGKTTVARILAKILKEEGVLRIGKFCEHKGRDLCAEYVGQTTPKTVGICRDAYGSVLFLDEAYAIYNGGSRNDYGKEAIDALIAEMENHADDFIVIMAGYTSDMDELLRANSGLPSRIPYTITFPNYSREQLADIFISMSTQNFEIDEEYEKKARDYFNSLPDEVFEAESFGNARFSRNLYERAWGKAVARCQNADRKDIVLTGEDFENAAETIQIAKPAPDTKTRKIGFT